MFCKNLLRHADVPTADYRVFRNAESAQTFLKDREDVPVVVKADGLAAGKGVIVCAGRAEALDAVERIARNKEFGAAGDQLVIEERLDGQEASVLAFTDGQTIITLPPTQDHKRAYDGDSGPNTGGMGAYCPAPLVDEEMLRRIEEHVLVPTVHAMKRARRPFRGVLYAGLMLTNQGAKVLEYNVRFGDPECQPLLMRLKTDLFEVLMATTEGRLETIGSLDWDPRPAVCVVMASEGYPGKYPTHKPIRGLDEAAKQKDVKVFHAGTTHEEWPGRDRRRTRAGRHGARFHDSQRQAGRVHGREGHPLGRRLVPERHLGQGPLVNPLRARVRRGDRRRRFSILPHPAGYIFASVRRFWHGLW